MGRWSRVTLGPHIFHTFWAPKFTLFSNLYSVIKRPLRRYVVLISQCHVGCGWRNNRKSLHENFTGSEFIIPLPTIWCQGRAIGRLCLFVRAITFERMTFDLDGLFGMIFQLDPSRSCSMATVIGLKVFFFGLKWNWKSQLLQRGRKRPESEAVRDLRKWSVRPRVNAFLVCRATMLQVRGAAAGCRSEPRRWRPVVHDTTDVCRPDRVVWHGRVDDQRWGQCRSAGQQRKNAPYTRCRLHRGCVCPCLIYTICCSGWQACSSDGSGSQCRPPYMRCRLLRGCICQ